MAKLTLTDITSGYLTATSYNANNALIEAAFENTLSRDGTIPNQMTSDLDMNSNDINNLRFLRTTGIILSGQTVTTAALVAAGIGVETQTATVLQTLFTLSVVTYLQGVNSLQVYINGVLQPATDYTETSTTSVTFDTGVPLGDLVTFLVQVTTDIGTTDAVSVSYTPVAGQITNVSDKLKETLSVLDYGATGDGSTDDSTEFTNAETAAKLVFIPKTTNGYELTSSVSTADAAWFIDPTLSWSQWSDDGQLDISRGFFTNSGANIWRFADRVFIGSAASDFAGDSGSVDGGNSWFDTTDYAGYLAINSQVTVIQDLGKYGVTTAARSSDNAGATTIGFGTSPVNDAASKNCFGFLAELQHENGTHSTGIEIVAKNKTTDVSVTPNTTGFLGVYGMRLFSGGDPAFGGSAVNPSACGILFVPGDSTWNTGIVFQKASLTSGNAIALHSEATGGAHRLVWYNTVGNTVFSVSSNASDADAYSILHNNDGIQFKQAANKVFSVEGATSSVNGLAVVASAAGFPVNLNLQGSDTNIDLKITPKGSGVLRFGAFTATGGESYAGFITIKDAAGTSRKVAIFA